MAKYRDWTSKIDGLQSRSKNLLIDEDLLQESMTVDGTTISVYLGDDIQYKINGKKANDWEVARLYNSREKAWWELELNMENRVAMAESLHTKMSNIAAQQYMAEAVMDRLTGINDLEDDNEKIIQNAFNKRIQKLQDLMNQEENASDISQVYKLPSPSPNYNLQVNFRYPYSNVTYGNGNKEGMGVRLYWSFLTNYDQIETTIKGFLRAIKPLSEFLKEDEDV